MKILMIFCSLLAFASCAVSPWKRADDTVSRTLPDVTVTAGGHCESSALMNALRYEGYEVTEAMITGGGGALSFMFQKGDFPFIGARNDDMRERFFEAAGIAWRSEIPEGADAGWKEIDGLLARGIPVVLRVDMRFLPYRYNGRYGAAYLSFGAHYVTLFGVDYAKETAIVSDTEFSAPQTIALKDLHRARTSDTKVFPPRAEYCWVEPPPKGKVPIEIDLDRLAAASLKTVILNYEEGALDGLGRYGGDLASLETYSRKKFLLPAVFEYMAGNIEDYGTGGASFRILYRNFILDASSRGSRADLSVLIPLLDDSIASWHALSAEFREAARGVKSMTVAERNALYARLKKTADELYIREKTLYTEMKKL